MKRHPTLRFCYERAADAQRLSIAAWVLQALAAERRREPVGDVGKKLDTVRAATRHSYPTADINDMQDR
jgi:hypothetical protein